MKKLRVFIAITAVALVMPLTAMGQKGKPTPPPAGVPCTLVGEVDSNGSTVQVGRAVASYGPVDQVLFIDKSLLLNPYPTAPGSAVERLTAADQGGEVYGPYYGQIRVLDDRIDYFFDTSAESPCVQDNTKPNLCPFHLTVVDGTALYSGKGKTRTLVSIAFAEGRTLLDYRPCDPAGDPVNCYFKLYGCYDVRDCPDGEGYVYASFDVRFK